MTSETLGLPSGVMAMPAAKVQAKKNPVGSAKTAGTFLNSWRIRPSAMAGVD